MGILKSASLRTKLIGMSFFTITFLGLGSYYNMQVSNGNFKTAILEKYHSEAEALGLKLSAQFYERYGDVQAFSINKSVQSMNSRVIQDDLDSYVTLYGIYDLILVVDTQGRFVSSNTKDIKGKSINQKELSQINYIQAPWFKAAMSGHFTEDKEKGFTGTYFEEPHVDPLLKAAIGESRVTTGFTSTIKDGNGQILGVITNRANSKWIDNELLLTYDSLMDDGDTKVQATLVNKEGLILAEMNVEGHGGKREVIYDLEHKFLKEDVRETHGEAGQLAVKGKSGSALVVDKNDGIEDVIGYHHLDNQKWISSIGWSTLVHDDAGQTLAPVKTAFFNFWLVFIGNIALTLVASVVFGTSLSKSVSKLSEILMTNSRIVAEASKRVAGSSVEISEGSIQQAAALQETVAAVDEISAMVDKNADAANRSKEVSGQSREAANRGRQIVDHMIQAIGEISQSNDQVGEQMHGNTVQLAEITKLINDIGSKTKVINEIVFQTKLLSFNASVEAARAGEYGKGFAVVAEEVGNLAQMSGNAAKEITSLLEESVNKVEAIVNESKQRVDRLMNEAKAKVNVGSETAANCNQALEEILTSVSSVDVLISEIAVASQEQSTGIREIAKAVGQMEQITQKNSSVAANSSASAEDLKRQSENLREVIGNLEHLVTGKKPPRIDLEDISRPDNLVSFTPRKEPTLKKTKNTHLKSSQASHEVAPMKKVSGGETPPSSDDPGFGS